MKLLKRVAAGKQTVVGFGAALVDILAHETDDFLIKTGAIKGGMRYVEKAFIEDTLSLAARQPEIVPGGSACNTTVGIGMLGGKTRFVGKSGQGVMARLLIAGLEKSGVEPALLSSNTPTGRVLTIITPDAQRSMFTFLGAAAETQPDEMRAGFFDDAAVVHVEGYMLFNEALIMGVMERAKAAGAAVSLDLASFNVVEESHVLLKRIVDDYVDIVLANEDEARVFTGIDDEAEALEAMAEAADIAVLKIGARGSYICHGGTTIHTPAHGGGDIVDTTGAGDLWASGFLYGLISGLGLKDSGRLASRCGFEVCRTVGAAIPAGGWERIHQCVNDIRANASPSSREG